MICFSLGSLFTLVLPIIFIKFWQKLRYFISSNSLGSYLKEKSYAVIFNIDNPFAKIICEELGRNRINLILMGSVYQDLSNLSQKLKNSYSIETMLIDIEIDTINKDIREHFKKIENFDIGMVFFFR